MRLITIIGAGQGGLLLAISLLQKGYKVTLINDKDENDLKNSRIFSSQVLFHSALEYEKRLKLNFWDNECPQHNQVTINIRVAPDAKISIRGKTAHYFQSVDQRLKFSSWIKAFKNLGGKFIVKNIAFDEIDSLCSDADLVIVATGKAALSEKFEKNTDHSPFSQPMRKLALLYAENDAFSKKRLGVVVNIVPGIGELANILGLSADGTYREMLLFEGIPDGEFDCWNNATSPEDHLHNAQMLIDEFVPWEKSRFKSITLSSDKDILKGGYTPIVRKPTAFLPSGKLVMGMADAIVLNDPLAGQGANNATKAAKIYLEAILDRKHEPFDKLWMEETFSLYWNNAQWSTKFTNKLLAPLDEHFKKLLVTSSTNPTLANFLVHSFDRPAQLFPWIESKEGIEELIASFHTEPAILENE